MKYGFGTYLKERMGTIAGFLMAVGIFGLTFGLYRFPPEAVFYPALLSALVLLGIMIWEWKKAERKHQRLRELISLPDDLMETLRAYDHQEDQDYQELMLALAEKSAGEAYGYQRHLTDTMEYFTTWVHQIKTPISSMRLRLEGLDSTASRALSEDLFRIEQYVEMVLTYLRLDSESTDYVFRECSVDEVIKSTLRKFAGQFIGRGLKLSYEETDLNIVTDEKWLAFVLEQITSNALKYTTQGGIHIYGEEDSDGLCVIVQDTGIGIRKEDLPRVFEKGFTGYNGRVDQKASGLGLYLCKGICTKLGHRLSIESELEKGTRVMIRLQQDRLLSTDLTKM